jgi:hypothetical protein
MDDFCNYKIEVHGRIDESDLNSMSPLPVTVIQAEKASMLFSVYADQAGLIGLLRHLHGRGIIFLSIKRES